MADDLQKITERQDNLEKRVGTLETTVEQQAGLRAAMDRDLGDLKAMLLADRGLIKAIDDTQSDHTKRLTRLETGMDEVKERLGAVEGRLGAVETTLTTVHVGVQAIHDLLTRNLEQGDDQPGEPRG